MKARKRVAHLAESALWTILVWDLGDRINVPMVKLGINTGLGADGVAWRCGFPVDDRIRVQRHPEQLDLFHEEVDEEAPGFWVT